MKAELTATELAARAGTSPEQVARLTELGILEPAEHGGFGPSDVHRVRLAQELDRAGVSFEDMGRAIAAGALTFGFVSGIFPRPPAVFVDQTFGELAEESGMPLDLIQELWTNYNLPAPSADQRVRADDVRMVAGRAELFRRVQGDRETLRAASRFFGDNLRRTAESQIRFFRERIIDPLLASGMPPGAVLETIAPISARMQENADELLRLLYERHLETSIHQTAIELIELAMEAAGMPQELPAQVPAIAFLDLGGYTQLTEARGDEAAAELAAGMASLVRRVSSDYGGKTVKFLGDGVMFHFPEPANAVACALDLVARADEVSLPPARVGINAGPVVFRDGDYFGRTVNVASRITDYARARQVLASEEVVAASSNGGAVFEPIGSVELKGVAGPVPLYRALPAEPSDDD